MSAIWGDETPSGERLLTDNDSSKNQSFEDDFEPPAPKLEDSQEYLATLGKIINSAASCFEICNSDPLWWLDQSTVTVATYTFFFVYLSYKTYAYTVGIKGYYILHPLLIQYNLHYTGILLLTGVCTSDRSGAISDWTLHYPLIGQC